MLLPDVQYLREMIRPWKLASFSVSLSWLLFGALNFGIADWDIGISLIMGGLTYLCAPWCVRVILISLRDRPRHWLRLVMLSLFVAWFVIDGVYFAYHSFAGHQMYRLENFYASSSLFFLAGSIWLYRGSIRDFVTNLQSILKRR